jgi:glycosyltransferase involved in cell wall biosynthesis
MRVLQVISGLDPEAGGTSAAVIGLAAAQVEAGMDVGLLATWRTSGGLSAGEGLRAKGVRVTQVGPAKWPLSRHPDLAAVTAEAVAAADVVHITGLWEDVQHQAARAARRAGRPYVMTPQGMLDPWSLSQRRWKKRLYLAWRMRRDLNGAAAIHYTAAAERDLVAPLGLRPPAIVEPNGVDLREFEQLPARGTFRSRYPQIGQRPLVLFLSRIHPKKGLDLLVPAFQRSGCNDATLVLAGPDSEGYGDVVRRMVRENRLEDRVVFTGMLRGAERVAAFADADLFVLPSYQENFGIAVVEALAAGTPVVISDRVNIHSDIYAAGVGGVVPPSVDAVAAELARWLNDPELRRRVAEKAPAFVRERYDWREIARRWGSHYAGIVGGAARS